MKRVKSSSSNLFQQFANGIGGIESDTTTQICNPVRDGSSDNDKVTSIYYPHILLAQFFQQGISSTPVMLWWEDVFQYIKNGDISSIIPLSQDNIRIITRSYNVSSEARSSDVVNASSSVSNKQSTMPSMSIQSEQVQLPVMTRIAKAIYEESGPWLLTVTASLFISLIFQSMAPLMYTAIAETCFLSVMMTKLMLKFDKPNRPQPLLENRVWEDIIDNVWGSQSTVEDKRKFIMGWFYDANFELLRREDVLTYLAWMRFGCFMENLSTEEFHSLKELDLIRLESEINSGLPLPRRQTHESPLNSMRFTLEQIRFRHKPLLFYGITHIANSFLINSLLSDLGFSYKTPSGESCLGYWHRPAIKQKHNNNVDIDIGSVDNKPTAPFVFAHGVGGSSFYFSLLKEISVKTNGDMIVLDLNFVSLRINDDVPSVTSQVGAVCQILDETIGPNTPATFAGHSYGSTILSWMVQEKPERVANAVFMDPICFQLHLKDILFKFHFRRADLAAQACTQEVVNPLSLQGVSNLAGTELHTNMAMFRHFPWATIELWPSDLEKNSICTKILVSEHDEIVPSKEVVELVANHNTKRKISKSDNGSYDWSEFLKTSCHVLQEEIVQAECLKGASHGDMIFGETYRAKAVTEVVSMIKQNSDALLQKESANFSGSFNQFANPFDLFPTSSVSNEAIEKTINAIPAHAASAWSGATSFLWT